MINLILYGVLGFVAYKQLAKPSGAAPVGNARSRVSIQGFSGILPVRQGNTGPYQGATSGAGRIAGNANQPWYNGALVSGAAVGGAAIAKGLVGLFDGGNTDNGPMIDDSDLEASSDEMAQSSESSTSNDEDPSYGEGTDESSEDTSGDEGYEDYA